MNVETCYLPVIRVLKAGLGFMSFIPDSFQALGVRVRLQAQVIATLSLGVGQSGQVGSCLISVHIGTYCELLSG